MCGYLSMSTKTMKITPSLCKISIVCFSVAYFIYLTIWWEYFYSKCSIEMKNRNRITLLSIWVDKFSHHYHKYFLRSVLRWNTKITLYNLCMCMCVRMERKLCGSYVAHNFFYWICIIVVLHWKSIVRWNHSDMTTT